MNSKEIIEIMSKVFEIEVSDISENASQREIMKWDSLQHLNLIVEIEDRYEISIDPEDIAVMVSIENIIEVLNKYKNV